MSGVVVQKFGGAALRDGPAVRRACALVRERGGARPVVVVSAHGSTTALLDAAAAAAAGGLPAGPEVRIAHRTLLRQLGLDGDLVDRYLDELARLLEWIRSRGRLDAGQRDYVLSFGERMSARITAAALRSEGVPAAPVDAFDAGLVAARRRGSTRPRTRALEGLRGAIEAVRGVAVVTGFLAADERGDVTNLGRNGSDWTAVLLGDALGADEVQLWKTVDGVLSADPLAVAAARTVERLGYAEAEELALHGASVLQADAAAWAARRALRVRLLNADAPERPGTRLVERTPAAGPVALVHRSGLLRAELPDAAPRAVGALLADLEELGCGAPWLELRARGAVAVLPDRPDVRATLAAHAADGSSGAGGPRVEDGLAAVAVVGRGVGADRRLTRDVLRELVRAGAPALQASLGSRPGSQAFLLRAGALEPALCALHARLLEPRPAVPREVRT